MRDYSVELLSNEDHFLLTLMDGKLTPPSFTFATSRHNGMKTEFCADKAYYSILF